MNTALSIRNLRKTYASGTQALKGLTFDIKKGEFFALLGPNGSGKSTLINTIAGSTKKTSGKVKIHGLDIETNREKTKMLIGVVPQEISFDSFFSVNEVLTLQSGYYGIRNNQTRIDEILEKLNLENKKHANTRALSGGMKRRLLVAKALVHNPKVLILDEPTAGVDVELRHTLWNYMRQLNKEGLTILLTTHYLEEAEHLCRRIAIINRGRLVALDTTKNLINSMGSNKRLTLTFKEKIEKIPEPYAPYNPKQLGEKEIALTFASSEVCKVLHAIEKAKLCPQDIAIDSEKLEDVFVKLTSKTQKT